MPKNILMPALSPTMEKGKLAVWHVKEGDTVEAGDIIAEIETDKATMEIEAIDDGTIVKIYVPAGTDNVLVNQAIAIMAEDGENADDILANADAQWTQEKQVSIDDPKDSLGKDKEEKVSVDTDSKLEEEPVKEDVKAEITEDNGTSSENPATASTNDKVVSNKKAQMGDRLKISPLAKRIAKEHQLDTEQLRDKGTGPKGRIVKKDVLAFIESGAKSIDGAADLSTSNAGLSHNNQSILAEINKPSEKIPHSKLREIIAKRLEESKRDIPHYYVAMDIEMDRVMDIRAQLNDGASRADKISVNDFIIKAAARALMDKPGVNVYWQDDAIIQNHFTDIAVAVSVDGGLITPIIKDVAAKSMHQISKDAKDMIGKARDKKLMPEDYEGGSITISNLGMYNVNQFTAIVNPPQSAILAVGAAKPQIKIDKNGNQSVASVMTIQMSSDHRSIDGVLAAEYLGRVKYYLENPALLLV